MSDFVQVCVRSDLPDVGAKHVDVEGVPVAVVNTVEGIFAIKDVCSHADVRLSEGEVEDCTIECWLHGSQFDLRTGIPISLPAITPVPVFDVRLVGEGPGAAVEVSRTARPIDPNEGPRHE